MSRKTINYFREIYIFMRDSSSLSSLPIKNKIIRRKQEKVENSKTKTITTRKKNSINKHYNLWTVVKYPMMTFILQIGKTWLSVISRVISRIFSMKLTTITDSRFVDIIKQMWKPINERLLYVVDIIWPILWVGVFIFSLIDLEEKLEIHFGLDLTNHLANFVNVPYNLDYF